MGVTGLIMPESAPAPDVLAHLHFESSPWAVGEVITSLVAACAPFGLTREQAGTLEIVLAEVLNNIAEHAYQEQSGRPVEVWLTREGGGGFGFHFIDRGCPMPGGSPPAGTGPDLPQEQALLPEGGFGWLLIRKLARDIRYRRRGQENHLTFRFVPTDG